jgi:hypothetical protein
MKITPTEAVARIQHLVGLKETGKWDDDSTSRVLRALQGSTFFDNKQLTRIEKKLMSLSTDLKAAADTLIQKNDALIALVKQLVAAANNNPPTADVQAVIDDLKAEAAKDDEVLNPPAP